LGEGWEVLWEFLKDYGNFRRVMGIFEGLWKLQKCFENPCKYQASFRRLVKKDKTKDKLSRASLKAKERRL
jgi:hypothetical protein